MHVLMRSLITSLILGFAAGAHGEFYSWTDADGNRRVSNIPPEGVRPDGTVRGDYHPYSVAAQHARMREKLAEQGAAIAAAEDGSGDISAERQGASALDLFNSLLKSQPPRE